MRKKEFLKLSIVVLMSFVVCISVGCGSPSKSLTRASSASSEANPGSGLPQSLPQMSLTPTSATITTRQTIAFSAPFGGVPLTWMVNGVAGGNSASGTIDVAGHYTAPLLPTDAPVTVSAQLVLAQGSAPLVAEGSVQIVNPAPQITQTVPTAISLGSPQMTVVGSGFNPESTVMLNGQRVTTTFVDTSHLAAQLPQGANASSVTVAVMNAAPGGGTTSTITLPVLSTGTPAATTHPLVAKLTASVPAGASILAEFGPDTGYGRKTWTQAPSSPGQPATLLVAGMRASTTYHMRLHFILADSTELLGEDETFTTGDVPAARVPSISVTQTPGMTPSPGIEMLDFVNGNQQQFRVAAVDLSGDLIWYYDYALADGTPQPVKQLVNGNIGVVISPGSYREVSLDGQLIRQVTVGQLNARLAAAGSNIGLTQIHHDFAELPNGMLVLLTNTVKNFDNFAGFPGTTSVLGDVLIALDADFNIVWTWSTFDHLDVNRQPGISLGTIPGIVDWTHSNGVVYSSRDKTLLLSSRHQSWVMKIDFNDGQGGGDILWQLGEGGDFTLVGGIDPIDWFYDQHFPYLINNSGPVFDLALFDNGNLRQVDINGDICGSAVPCYSRPLVMTIDETAKTATLKWDPHSDFSNFGGVSEPLASGRFEYTLSFDQAIGAGIVVESTIDPTPNDILRFKTAQSCYRATRLPSLYPGITWESNAQ